VAAPAPASVPTADADGRLKASPLAKALAREKGIDLHAVAGSGDGGRVVKRDVETYQPAAAPAVQTQAHAPAAVPSFAPVVGSDGYEEVTLSQMRKTIARRLSESKFSAPHFYLTIPIDMGVAMQLRKELNEQQETKISFNDLVIKAVAVSLRKHPKVNASWLGDKIRYHHGVHVGMAVAVDEGLVVPVLRNADLKGLTQISAEAKDFAARARTRKLTPEEMQGNTFTISNLGMFGIEEFTAIINPPDACILAVGAIQEQPVVKNGEIVPGHIMRITLSCDHRAVDGAVGSAFLQTLKFLLENPVRMLL
jgi:pyruvate dehydrogenase E2 component (dihydrolipoamide acetyltransferase)